MKKENFKQLLEATRNAYNKSDIKKKNPNWSYSICATRIVTNKPLILGFNWGANKESSYNSQDEIPKTDFMNTDNIYLGSLADIKPCIEHFFKKRDLDLFDIGHSNFCFFRSDSENQISYNDLELCKPLFWDFINFSKPSMILGFSHIMRDYMITNNFITIIKEKKIVNGQGSYNVKIAKMKINDIWIPIYFLPHPNYPMSDELRNKAWKFCFD